MNQVIDIIYRVAVLLFAVSVHESAHGWVAEKCGDPTARDQGRITLNPIPHIDLIGSIIFPLILALTPGAPIFGWAKPVMVNPYNLRNPKRDNMLISAAGPLSNIAVATVGIIIFLIFKHNLIIRIPALGMVLLWMIIINVFLAIFNLLPVPPLDGSGIVEGLLRGEALRAYEKIRPYGFIILIVILFTGILNVIARPIFRIIQAILGF